MVSVLAWTLCLLASLGLFGWQIYGRLRLLPRVRQAQRFDRIPERIKHMLVGAFGQMKFFSPGQDQPAGMIHALVFWGFLILGAQILTMFLRGWAPASYLPLLGPDLLGGPYMLVRDVMEGIVLLCTTALLVRWLVTHPRRLMGFKPAESKLAGHSHWEAIVILIFISTIMISGLVYDGGRMVVGTDDPHLQAERAWAPLSALAARVLARSGPEFSLTASNAAWWLHNLVVLAFLNLLPLSKHFHVITSIPNVFFTKLEPYGRLSKQDLENTEIYGTSQMRHFDWKQILDMYTCTECGRCSAECPATLTDKPLAPRQLLLDLRNYLYAHPESVLDDNHQQTIIGEHTGVTDEVIWACTTCRACEEACPVHIEFVDKIVDMRRHLVQEQARFPTELTRTFKGLETQGNPWGIGADRRDEWAEGLQIPHVSEKPDAEYLFFVGCAGSFDDRAKKITKAVAKILSSAGLSYAILGKEEPCNGDTARRLGNEYLYQSMASAAVEVLNGYKVRKIITNCPHCFNTIANEFPEFGGQYEVVHASQLVAELLREGKVKVQNNAAAASIVYHDSCYLGRYNDVYDAPRDILRAIPGVVLKEAARSRNKGLCCGAGGGRMWIEENPSQRVNTLRVEQLLETKPDIIASACPYCMTMLSDGVKEKQVEDRVQTRDVLEILADAVA